MKRAFCTALAAMALILANSAPGHAHGHFRGSVWIGSGWSPWWGPVYPYYGAPVVVQPPPVIVREPPAEYVQPAPQPEEQNFWYYCRDPKGYYPYVKKCPTGWMKVVPSPAPTDEDDEEE